jgi:fermentation-respiration switch protein FrsA (DUF1100 family)
MKLASLFCIALVAIASCAGCAVIPGAKATGWERRSLFQPNKYPAGEWLQTEVFVEDANFTAADGTKLHGWYAKGHALLLHGNGGNVTLLAPTIRILNRKHNLAVLALDYRGYGKSEGKPSEEGILQDARAARKWLATKNKIAESDVILLGQSLGGGVAVDLASKDGCRALVLAGTFTSIPDVAQHHIPYLPMKLLLATRMNSLEKIKSYRGPLLMSHGDADEVIPYKQGQALFAACPSENKLFITNPGGKHNDGQSDEYRAALDAFLENLPPLGGSGPKLVNVDVDVTEMP